MDPERFAGELRSREGREGRVLEAVDEYLPQLRTPGDSITIELIGTDPSQPMFTVAPKIPAVVCGRGVDREAADNGMGT